ncbi:MAG TPA: helix-hairpin-helix domain-containing protein [Candidatus Limnocylindrales bacterium]|nr:helix-hairpin-helix domain-containing protein [Candidatus Limnocylindrales bacterium]
MDRFGEWRPIQAAEDEPEKLPKKAEEPADKDGKSDQVRLYAALAAVVLAVTGAVIWLTSTGQAAGSGNLAINAAAAFVPHDSARSPWATEGSAISGAAVVVDVQGAVLLPGVHRLTAGARIADAIAAAGGYSTRVDIARAAAILNLAAPVADGAKVHVPSLGDVTATVGEPALGPSPGSGASGLVNVNTATADDLDSLPGIGPVTAAKIIDARTEAPFASVEELLSREVLGASTFENLRELVSVGP